MILKGINFVTGIDTKKNIVPIQAKLRIRKDHLNATGEGRFYLHVTGDGIRDRIGLDIYAKPEHFDNLSQTLSKEDPDHRTKNLVLDNYKSRTTGIKVAFHLTDRVLTVEAFVHEFLNGVPRTDFISFSEAYIELNKSTLANGTYRRYQSVIKKLRKYKKTIPFANLTLNEIKRLQKWMADCGNAQTTIQSNLRAIKTFLNGAKKSGINLSLNPDELKISRSRTTIIELDIREIKKLRAYAESQFINPAHKLICCYYLFSAYTGLRFSEVFYLERDSFENEVFKYYEQKKDRFQSKPITNSIRELLNLEPDLFVKKFTNEYINRELKVVARNCQIKKKITFHTARHSFATNFLRLGGNVVDLQKLLGHSKITQTMEYVHLIEQETNTALFLMDELLESGSLNLN